MVLIPTLKLLEKSDRSTENGTTFPDPVKNPSVFPATIKISVLLMSSIALISFWTRTIYRTWFQQLLHHSTTLIIHTLWPISTLNQQLTKTEQTHIRCSLHCERWTVKGSDCTSALHALKKLPNGRTIEWNWMKQLIGWKVEWSLEARSNGWNSVVCDEL